MYPQRSVMTCGLATALEPPHFNHAPVRGAIGASFSRRSRAGSFNPRTRVGCDQCVCVSCLQLHCVSIHAPAWGATWAHTFFRYLTTVSIHAPAWGATAAAGLGGHGHAVSIHAPAWGATSATLPTSYCGTVFQSTHPRGVRRCPCRRYRTPSRFQSTHPRGVRPSYRCRCPVRRPVSIHAPAWGATSWTSSRIPTRSSFNPRTRVGCDLVDILKDTHEIEFQSTHPRGVRRCKCRCSQSGKLCFNPRTRVGCDCFHVLSSRFP